ncbi:MAG: DUF4301 family protein, partial [Flavobacteriales bacterium]
MIKSEDQQKLQAQGRSVELVQRQWDYLKRGTPLLSGIFPATLNNKGITKLSLKEEEKALAFFNKQDGSLKWIKFIPASGAASRMFKPFFDYFNAKKDTNFVLDFYLNSDKGKALKPLFHNLKKLPFYSTVQAKVLKEELSEVSSPEVFFESFVKVLLFDDSLQYPKRPKALIPFFNDKAGQELTPFY